MYLYRKIIYYFIILMLMSINIYANLDSLSGLAHYKALKDKKEIYGKFNCKGSKELAKYLNNWLNEFTKIYPQVKYNFDYNGSLDGIRALINSEANVIISSTPIQKEYLKSFIKKKGYKPVEIKVALDALVIYVNRDNKVNKISLQELDAIFSLQRKRGYLKDIRYWSDISKNVDVNNSINIYLCNKNSGSRTFFKEFVMLSDTYNLSKVKNGSISTTKELLEYIANDKNSIGFGTIGVDNYKVKKLAISKELNFPAYYPDIKNIKDSKYPLIRYYYIYLDIPSNKKIPTLFYEFCKYILSYEGQKSVLKNNGLPLSPKDIGLELSKFRRD